MLAVYAVSFSDFVAILARGLIERRCCCWTARRGRIASAGMPGRLGWCSVVLALGKSVRATFISDIIAVYLRRLTLRCELCRSILTVGRDRIFHCGVGLHSCCFHHHVPRRGCPVCGRRYFPGARQQRLPVLPDAPEVMLPQPLRGL